MDGTASAIGEFFGLWEFDGAEFDTIISLSLSTNGNKARIVI
jgi:hypothetical protein